MCSYCNKRSHESHKRCIGPNEWEKCSGLCHLVGNTVTPKTHWFVGNEVHGKILTICHVSFASGAKTHMTGFSSEVVIHAGGEGEPRPYFGIY